MGEKVIIVMNSDSISIPDNLYYSLVPDKLLRDLINVYEKSKLSKNDTYFIKINHEVNDNFKYNFTFDISNNRLNIMLFEESTQQIDLNNVFNPVIQAINSLEIQLQKVVIYVHSDTIKYINKLFTVYESTMSNQNFFHNIVKNTHWIEINENDKWSDFYNSMWHVSNFNMEVYLQKQNLRTHTNSRQKN